MPIRSLWAPGIFLNKTFHNKFWSFLAEGVFMVKYTESLEKKGPKSSGKSGSNMGILFSVIVCFGPETGLFGSPSYAPRVGVG